MRNQSFYDGTDIVEPDQKDYTTYFAYRHGEVIAQMNRYEYETSRARLSNEGCIFDSKINSDFYLLVERYESAVKTRKFQLWEDLKSQYEIKMNSEKLKEITLEFLSGASLYEDIDTFESVALLVSRVESNT